MEQPKGAHKPPPYRWDDISKQIFTQQLDSQPICEKIEKLSINIDKNDDVDAHVQFLGDILRCSLEPNKKNRRNKKPKKKKNNPKPWYDQTCYEMNKRLKLTAQLLIKYPINPHLRDSFVKSKEWKQALIHRLESIEEKDPKEYWKMIDELRE